MAYLVHRLSVQGDVDEKCQKFSSLASVDFWSVFLVQFFASVNTVSKRDTQLKKKEQVLIGLTIDR